MKWLDDKDSVTQEELEANRDDAYAAHAAIYWAVAAAAYSAAAVYSAACAAKWVDTYFERSGENKEDYINALKHNGVHDNEQ